jgi:hypothetical protein
MVMTTSGGPKVVSCRTEMTISFMGNIMGLMISKLVIAWKFTVGFFTLLVAIKVQKNM